MSISFTCPSCKKAYKVKDEWAGKKATCSNCQQKITIPRPTPAAAAAPADVEAMAAAALADEAPPPEPVQQEAAAPAATTAISFNCPQCDDAVQLPLDMAGKKAPCPSCRRIIRVPMPTKQEPKDWRKVETRGPSLAKKADQPALAGAWGSTTAASTVSRETLEEVGAVPVVRTPLTLRQKANRITILVASVLFAAAIAWWTVNYLQQTQQEKTLTQALQQAENAGVHPAVKAEVFRAAGVYYTRAEQAEPAEQQFTHAASQLPPSLSGPEADAPLIDIALSIADLGSSNKEEIAPKGDRRLPWPDVNARIRTVLGQIRGPEARAEAIRLVGAKLVRLKQADQVEGLIQAADYLENSRLKGIAGLILLGHKEEALARAAADKGLTIYMQPRAQVQDVARATENPDDPQPPPPPEQTAKSPVQQPLPAPLVALLVATGQAKKAQLPEPPTIPPNAMTAYAEGLAWRGDDIARLARLAADPLPLLEQVKLQVVVAGAAVGLDQVDVARPILEKLCGLVAKDYQELEKQAIAEEKDDFERGRGNFSWMLLRLTRLCNQAGLPEETVHRMVGVIPDSGLRGLAQLQMFQRRLGGTDKPADPEWVKLVGTDQSLARGLAWEALARHNARRGSAEDTLKVVEAIQPESLRPLGLVGAALGIQGKDP